MKSAFRVRVLYLISSFTAALGLTLALSMAGSPPSRNITYRLDWEWGRAKPHDHSPGWTTINDLGYQVSVKRGYLVTGQVQLIPCQDGDHQHPLSRLINPLRPQPASAGHGGERNETKSTRPYVESLLQPVQADLETISVSGTEYCQAHYLVAYAVEAAKNLPLEMDMIGTSLFLEGEYHLRDAKSARSFTLKTNLAWGALTDLNYARQESPLVTNGSVVAGDGPVIVTFHRNLGALFDGVDFDHMSETDRVKTVLRSLTKHLEVSIARQ